MNWIKSTISLSSQHTDVAAALLLDFGIEGVEITDEYENMRFIEGHESNWDYVDEALLNAEKGLAMLTFYLPEDTEAYVIENIRKALQPYGQLETITVKDDWTDAWRQHYKPFRASVTAPIIIVPEWEDYAPNDGEIVFKIDPGHVFGTGQHESTALCIEMIAKFIAKDRSMLDIGCGSGILSIIGLLLGAKDATAIDIDREAIKVTNRNAMLNNIESHRIKAFSGNLLENHNLVQGSFGTITANIVADVIIPLIPIVRDLLIPDGRFIVGGIIDSRQEEVSYALSAAGFTDMEFDEANGWYSFAAAYRN